MTTENIRTAFLPFTTPTIGQEEIQEVADSMASGWLTTGPKTAKFIEKFKSYVGANHAVAVNSATAGLHISYLAAGLGPGRELLTSPMTFVATANTALHCGARVAFADIELETLNINPAALDAAVTPATQVIAPVHFAGLPCDMDAVMKAAGQRCITVVEDAAHAAGAVYKDRKIGIIGDMTVFSFHPNKNITTGEGGMITFNDARFAEKLELLSFHGMNKNAWKRYTATGSPHYDVDLPGFKYNMLDIQAAIGIHQLDKLDAFNARRAEIVKHYYDAFSGMDELILPKPPAYAHKHVWHLFTPLVKSERMTIDRDQFMAGLKERNIGTGYHYRAVHLHPLYQSLGFKRGQFPKAEYASDRIVSLPLFPKMSDGDVEDVINAVKNLIARSLNK